MIPFGKRPPRIFRPMIVRPVKRSAAAVISLALLASAAQQQSIQDYIRSSWAPLTRSNQDLAAAAVDPKVPRNADGTSPVYVNPKEQSRVERNLRSVMRPSDFAKIRVAVLPANEARIREHGLLYLPEPYVVPGGRFNEMYGWDSYFIQMGLLESSEIALAKDMADNFLYEVREYGKVLNANRTYYLTRSQPPFLAAMVLAAYQKTLDRRWLEESVPALEAYYDYWISDQHMTSTGLSRYFDSGQGPAPEVISGEVDDLGRTHYDLVRAYFRTHRIRDYDVSRFYDRNKDQLTDLFYKGDRSMRESGFDPSNRFGPFNADIIQYNPVCLNSLLYLMETQMAEIAGILGRGTDASTWSRRAEERAATINRLMWDSKDGLYYDYDFETKRVRRYPFLTTFYPLWVGIASRLQAEDIVRHLRRFERPGGLQTSARVTGDQWDAPFGWAPLQWIAVEGLRRYGYNREADRISRAFLSLVIQEFQRTGTIVEKYDVVRRTSTIAGRIQFGYSSNEIGFGWTNAVFLALLREMPDAQSIELLGATSPN